MPEETIQMPKLHMRAAVKPSSYNPETRTFEVVFATGAEVSRSSWRGAYTEILSMNPAHIRMERINSGRAPILNSHNAWDLKDVLGVASNGRVTANECIASARLSERESIAEIRSDVADGIIANISVGYVVHRWEETTDGEGNVTTRLATDWEPYEISLVPIPADGDSYVRKAEQQETYPCIVVRQAGAQDNQQRKDDEMTKEITVPVAAGTPAALQATQPTADEVRTAATRAEQARGIEIRFIGQKAKMTDEEVTKFITEGTSVEDVRKAAFDKLAASSESSQSIPARSIQLNDQREAKREAMENLLMHRISPAKNEMSKDARDFRGMGLMDIARDFLEAEGVDHRKLAKMSVASRALHTTSDFPIILGNIANKTLRQAYEQAKQTFRPFVNEVSLNDFKTVTKAQLGEAPQLLEVKEGAEFTRGTLGEAKESYALKTHGRVVNMSRQMLINDDLNGFARLAQMWGLQCANLESDLVWNIIIKNVLMGDGKALFHVDHGNILTGTATALSEDGLDAGRQAIRGMKGLDGTTPLAFEPTHLITGTKLETKAQKLMAAVAPTTSGDVNVFAGSLQRVVETRLDKLPATNWFLAAAGQGDMIDLAYLDGARGPQTEDRPGFDVDGVDYKVRFDVVAKAIESKFIVKLTGAA